MTHQLHDIRDPAGFIAATINKVHLVLTPQDREDLIQEGHLILLAMAKNYRPGIGGRDPSGSRFSGYAAPRFQLEASAFRGREPDERRWNIERPKLDSWSVRASWTPSPSSRCRSATAG